MRKPTVERRIAAIVAVDVVGYARMMEADEVGALAGLHQLRADISHFAAVHYGRTVKEAGDGFILEFNSPINAIHCAVAIQRTRHVARENDTTGFLLRAGIHLGDVIVDKADLIGNSVNIAARLEQLCEPGKVLISGPVYDATKDKLTDLAITFAGKNTIKNISEPINVFSINPMNTESARHYSLYRPIRALYPGATNLANGQSLPPDLHSASQRRMASVMWLGIDEDQDSHSYPIMRNVVTPFVEEHYGVSVPESSVNSLLFEFPSVVDAVACAADIQKKNARLRASRHSQALRIAVTIGEVEFWGATLRGECVLLAEQLCEVCRPSEIIVSTASYDHLLGKDKIPIKEAGEVTAAVSGKVIKYYKLLVHSQAARPRVLHDQKFARKKLRRRCLDLVFGATFWVAVMLSGPLILIGGLWMVVTIAINAVGPLDARTFFTVKPDYGLADVASELSKRNIISSAMVFRYGAWPSYRRAPFLPGVYDFTPGVTIADVIKQLRGKPLTPLTLKIRPSMTSLEIVALLNSNEYLTGTVRTIPSDGSLLAETYTVPVGTDRNAVIYMMKYALETEVAVAWGDGSVPFENGRFRLPSKSALIVLASLVEAEARNEFDQRYVAAVFLNRLARGMPLQSDSALMYGLFGKSSASNVMELTLKQMSDSWYNTFARAGLPAFPIGNPSRRGLASAIHPVDTDALYFLRDSNGRMMYARSEDEQERYILSTRENALRYWTEVSPERAAEGLVAFLSGDWIRLYGRHGPRPFLVNKVGYGYRLRFGPFVSQAEAYQMCRELLGEWFGQCGVVTGKTRDYFAAITAKDIPDPTSDKAYALLQSLVPANLWVPAIGRLAKEERGLSQRGLAGDVHEQSVQLTAGRSVRSALLALGCSEGEVREAASALESLGLFSIREVRVTRVLEDDGTMSLLRLSVFNGSVQLGTVALSENGSYIPVEE
jgi:cell division protein YceG involved in septum cleavage/class 3 adenylate cyclase